MVVFFNLCGDVLGSNDSRCDGIYSRVRSPQHPYPVVRIGVLFLTLTWICKVWLLPPDLMQRSGNAAVESQGNELKDRVCGLPAAAGDSTLWGFTSA